MGRLIKTIAMALVGAIIGLVIGTVFDPADYMYWVWFFMGVPAGWSFLENWFGHLLSRSLPLMLFLLTMRVVLAGLIGWVLIPIEIVRSLIDVFRK